MVFYERETWICLYFFISLVVVNVIYALDNNCSCIYYIFVHLPSMHFFMTERHEVSFIFHYLRYTELCMYTLVHFAYGNKVYVYTWRIQIECKCTPGLRFPLETLIFCCVLTSSNESLYTVRSITYLLQHGRHIPIRRALQKLFRPVLLKTSV